jgi:calcineurin-like phosphoesterase family protein
VCRTIHFIEGNHDKVARIQQPLFASWGVLSEINVAKQRIVLCHYAMRVWPRHAQGAWQLYGHSHGNLPDEPLSLSMDVGIDSHDFRPWNFDEIQSVMKTKSIARSLNECALRNE